MGSFVKRWGWLAVAPVLVLGVVSWRLGAWESSTARRQAAEAAGVPIERVELRDGLNVHLTGFATGAERDAAVARVAALRSSWVVTGDLIGVAGSGAEVASAPSSTTAGGSPAVVPSVVAAGTSAPSVTTPATTTPTTAVPVTVPPAVSAPSGIVPAAGTSTGAALVAALDGVGPVGFDGGSAALRPDEQAVLDRAAALLRADTSGRVVRVIGHTDTDGPAAGNQRLSLLRARAVVAHLVAAGVDPARLEVAGAGEDAPAVSPELTPADKERNRRIEWGVGS